MGQQISYHSLHAVIASGVNFKVCQCTHCAAMPTNVTAVLILSILITTVATHIITSNAPISAIALIGRCAYEHNVTGLLNVTSFCSDTHFYYQLRDRGGGRLLIL